MAGARLGIIRGRYFGPFKAEPGSSVLGPRLGRGYFGPFKAELGDPNEAMARIRLFWACQGAFRQCRIPGPGSLFGQRGQAGCLVQDIRRLVVEVVVVRACTPDGVHGVFLFPPGLSVFLKRLSFSLFVFCYVPFMFLGSFDVPVICL